MRGVTGKRSYSVNGSTFSIWRDFPYDDQAEISNDSPINIPFGIVAFAELLYETDQTHCTVTGADGVWTISRII